MDGRDELNGGSGADILEGGEGADIIIGGSGVDTVDYSGSSGGVRVDLENNSNEGFDAEGDDISGVQVNHWFQL